MVTVDVPVTCKKRPCSGRFFSLCSRLSSPGPGSWLSLNGTCVGGAAHTSPRTATKPKHRYPCMLSVSSHSFNASRLRKPLHSTNRAPAQCSPNQEIPYAAQMPSNTPFATILNVSIERAARYVTLVGFGCRYGPSDVERIADPPRKAI